MTTLSMTILNIEVGGGSKIPGVAMEKDVRVGLIVARDGRAAIDVGWGSTICEPCEVHAVQRTISKRKGRDFIVALMHYKFGKTAKQLLGT